MRLGPRASWGNGRKFFVFSVIFSVSIVAFVYGFEEYSNYKRKLGVTVDRERYLRKLQLMESGEDPARVLELADRFEKSKDTDASSTKPE
ncbi:MAG: hypothetical protein MHM6MM_000302 [Cercozoa sp. M6MM]